jgi:hypothetical protein
VRKLSGEMPEKRYLELFTSAQNNMRSNKYIAENDPAATQLLCQLPATSKIFGVVVSPKKDRKAWQVLRRCPGLIDRIIALVRRSPRVADVVRFEIWVTEGDGSRPRLIGAADSFKAEDILTHYLHPDFYWSPNSRNLSFEYHHSLWTVGVD